MTRIPQAPDLRSLAKGVKCCLKKDKRKISEYLDTNGKGELRDFKFHTLKYKDKCHCYRENMPEIQDI